MRYLLIFSVFLLGIAKAPSTPKSKSVFGVRIGMHANNELYTFEARRYDISGIIRERRSYSKDDFIRILSGEWPSNFNPERKDLFKEHNILGGMIKLHDTISIKKVPFCPAFDSLWKIRFDIYPFRTFSDRGWANGYLGLGQNQKVYIGNRYQINSLDTDFIIDTCFWMLLKDVTDTMWITDYKSK